MEKQSRLIFIQAWIKYLESASCKQFELPVVAYAIRLH